MFSDLSHSHHIDRRQLSLRLRQTNREPAVAGRIVAAVIIGLVLLMASAIINIAKGAGAAGWSPLWISWAFAAAIVVVVAFGAATVRLVWGVLSFVCFIAGIVLTASLPWFAHAAEPVAQSAAQAAQSFGLSPPIGAAMGAALVSGAMGIAAVVVTVAFFGASYFLLRHRDQHAH
jgi:hypothetical protein